MHGTIRILGKPEPVSLEGIFTDVLVLETPVAFDRYDIKLLRSGEEQLDGNKPRKNGLALVKEGRRRVFILGKPGAGKTTFLKYVTLRAAKGELGRIPIFVSLKEWADSGTNLMQFLVNQFDVCGFPSAQPFVEHILGKGDATILFDGLDEVNQEGNQRSRMIGHLRDFSNKYWNSQCLVTCRVAATEYTFDQFTYVELADFTDRQVETFIKKWFKGSRKKRTLFTEAFNRTENRGLQELARLPLLLSLLCLSFDATLEFPQRRVEIYEEAIEALLKKWDTSRSIKRDEIYRGLSLGRKRQLFARVAAQTFQDDKYFLSQSELAKLIVAYLQLLPQRDDDEEIDGDTVLKAIEAQHGIFSERAHKIYSFSHLTFQEYFTAKHIASDTTGRALQGLLDVENLTNDRWREVILLTASLLDDGDAFFDVYLQSMSRLALQEPLLKLILEWVEERTRHHEGNVASLQAYYCYLILNLILFPSFEQAETSSSLSFSRRYSDNEIMDICFALADKLDRGHCLRKLILADTMKYIRAGHVALRRRQYDKVASFPSDIIDPDSSLALHVCNAFLFVLTITNLGESEVAEKLRRELRPYVSQLRQYSYAMSIEHSAYVATMHSVNREIGIDCSDLVVPPESAAQLAWVNLAQKLYRTIRQHAFRKEQLTGEETERIAKFFVAARLLIDCLALSVVSDRASIEQRIFRGPKSNENRKRK